jgi:hypothetical protein
LGAVQVPPPDPNSPEGMAFVFSAGMVDPRIGKSINTDRLPMLLIQGWAAQSKLYHELGIRYHPELATKHLKGGGQFQVAEIVDGPPPPPEPAMDTEGAAEKILEIISENNPEFAANIRRIRDTGSDSERSEAIQKLGSEMNGLQNLADYIQGNL